jgi:hypothetical protein
VPAVWRLITHWSDPEAVLAWSRREGRIAIGHGYLGNLRENGFVSPQQISAAVREALPHYKNYGWVGQANFDFCYTMRVGDYVILNAGGGQRSLVVKVAGEYEFVSPEHAPIAGDDWQHQRRVDVTPFSPDAVWRAAGAHPAPGYSVRWGLIRCAKDIDEVRQQ